MKTNFPRHANVPADFIFIGKGGTFEPHYGDQYYFVTETGCSSTHFYGRKSDYAENSDKIDYYVKKNGPTHLLNKPQENSKMKTNKVTLDFIKARYPAAFAALPKGWRFLNFGEKIGEGQHWAYGLGPFKDNVNPKYFSRPYDEKTDAPHICKISAKKNMYTLTKTQQNYYGIQEIEIPAGYRVLKTGEIGGENCRFLLCHSFVFGNDVNHTYKATDFTVVIAPIKKKKKDAIPGLVWPAEVKKDGAAKDLIYVGRGQTGGISGLSGHITFSFEVDSGEYLHSSRSFAGNGISHHYFVPKDHPILAKYNLNPTRETKAELKKENDALRKELEELKRKVKEFAESVK